MELPILRRFSRSFLEAATRSPLWLSIYAQSKLVNKPFDDLTLFDHVLRATSEQTLLVILNVLAKRFCRVLVLHFR